MLHYHDVSMVALAGAGIAFEITPITVAEQTEFFEFHVKEDTGAVLLTVSDPQLARVKAPDDIRVFLIEPQGTSYRFAVESELVYVDATDERTSVAIINDPKPGVWQILISSGGSPFQANLLLLPKRITKGGSPLPKPRCRLCKSTAKALALSIVAAATLPAIPQALVLAVAKFLGSAVTVAAACIAAVIGDIAEVIAEKLCKKITLC